MQILILEDEEPAALRVRQFVEQSELPVAGLTVLRSVAKAQAWLIGNAMPDLVFSDIELLDGNVFELYRRVAVTCPIIFLTAYDQFLLQAFQVNGIAYLLKPFTYPQFEATLAKYQAMKNSFATPAAPQLSPALVQELRQALQHNARSYRQRFSVRLRNDLHLLAVDDVAYLQADEGVIFAVDKAGSRFPLGGTLTELEQQLDPNRFFRLNRSELVNIAYVEKAEAYFNNRLAVKIRYSATALITSAAQTPEFRKWLEG
ncbi:LytR/AlgR family response regulator transcription factor [Hymenobacter lucidus]|uniref:LytTR family DNA-binding domain-containing protein n=1 Tax=Hymenobacter lucidus TaxID=2880930 RepID=A0ABS8ALK7_9BACT|nr:LytTR family DNA-binding domain-containing protein [Hymenobacter lucidus]MCB2407097.1 LytTR family DNA-binding domain-containing protein [Hymenobacter lucidus]